MVKSVLAMIGLRVSRLQRRTGRYVSGRGLVDHEIASELLWNCKRDSGVVIRSGCGMKLMIKASWRRIRSLFMDSKKAFEA